MGFRCRPQGYVYPSFCVCRGSYADVFFLVSFRVVLSIALSKAVSVLSDLVNFIDACLILCRKVSNITEYPHSRYDAVGYLGVLDSQFW
jgi:hypothetical protein